MKRVIIPVLLLALVLAAGCGVKLFVIGEPMDGDTLAIDVQAHDNQVDIYLDSLDSAMAISNIQYRYEGTVLHLTIWKVLSSPLNRDGNKCLYYEITDETEIWLGGKRIWSRE